MEQLIARKAVTIQDVARAAGVAKSTASSAFTGNGRISHGTREAILQTAQEMGFEANFFAQQLSNGSTRRTIGLFAIDLNLGVGILKIREIQKLLTEAGYEVPLYSYGSLDWGDARSHAALMRSLRRQKPLAIVFHSADMNDLCRAELRRYCEDGGTALCYDYERPTDIECDSVVFDREDNTYQAARHLVQLGHRKIGFFSGGISDPRKGARYRGFARALNEVSAEAHDNWIWNGGIQETGGAQLAASFLQLRQRPSAVCIVNDQAAMAFVTEVQRAGLRVPQDVSVVGHDNSSVGIYSMPPLTTVSHPIEEISRTAVELLCSRLDGTYSAAPRMPVIRGEVIIRESSGPAE